VKLLLDENLSDRIIPQILDLHPGSAHVKAVNLVQADDGEIWEFARRHGFTIVSKDSDFHQRSLL
jgi:predicted nuclease of predicted toxin-antitoxin system